MSFVVHVESVRDSVVLKVCDESSNIDSGHCLTG
jgi:hypothetical protein